MKFFNASRFFSIISVFFLGQLAHGQCVPGSQGTGTAFTCFDQEDADKVFIDLTSAFAPTTVSGAGSLGKLFGVEVGLMVAASQAPNIQEVVDEYDSNIDIPGIPMAGITAVTTLPYGIGIEGSFVPKVDIDDEGSFQSLNLGVRWTVTDIIPMGLINVALKAGVMDASAEYTHSEDTGNLIYGTVTENARFDIRIKEVGAVVGLNFKIFEPFIGASSLESDGSLHADGSSSTGAPIDNVNEQATASGVKAYGGVVVKLPFMRISTQIGTFQDVQSAAIKFAAKF